MNVIGFILTNVFKKWHISLFNIYNKINNIPTLVKICVHLASLFANVR